MNKKYPFLGILALVLVYLIFAGCGTTPFESDMGDLLSRSEVRPLEDDMLSLLNAERSSNSLPVLASDPDLREVAVAHSEDMFLNDFFDHVNPNDETPADRADVAGIEYDLIGENIAMNSGYSDPVQVAHDSLMASPGHRANILSDQYDHVGIGIATDGDVYYYTQLFALLSEPGAIVMRVYKIGASDPWSELYAPFEKAWQQ